MKRRIGQRDRRRLYHIVSRIYWMFNYDGWRVRYERIYHNRGLCKREKVPLDRVGIFDLDAKLIRVDYRYDILDTIVHECLHVIYPDLPECEIVVLTTWVMDNLSRTQAQRIIEHTSHFLV